jgi:hypothetical protein
MIRVCEKGTGFLLILDGNSGRFSVIPRREQYTISMEKRA